MAQIDVEHAQKAAPGLRVHESGQRGTAELCLEYLEILFHYGVELRILGTVAREASNRRVVMHYFAYGSNLSTRFIRDYTPGAKPVLKADLPNYQVEFRHYSADLGGGISSIIETPAALVRGVIYDVSESELERLDILESVPEGLYRRETFIVLGQDGQWHRADLYRVSVPGGPYTPSTSYVDFMIEGAREHGLHVEYIERLVDMRKTLG